MGHSLQILDAVRESGVVLMEDREKSRNKKQISRDDDLRGHLPEWVEIFGQLKDEAEELYPDGRIRILVPKRKKRAV